MWTIPLADGAHIAENEIFNLIFTPGFSTAERITSVSGRGVGMDVVRKQIHKLRGKIEIQSTLGRGATFRLKLPLTLAIIDGLLVGVAQERYLVPIFAVREMFRPTPEMLVQRMAACLEPGGYLFIGHSETLNGIEHPLRYVPPAIYRSRA